MGAGGQARLQRNLPDAGVSHAKGSKESAGSALLQRPTTDSAQASESSATANRGYSACEGGTSRAGAAQLAAALRGTGRRACAVAKGTGRPEAHSNRAERRQSEETKRLRQELSDKQDDSQAELADAQQQIAELAEERDVLRELLTECEISRDELQRERDEKEEEVSSLQEKLGQAEQAHKEVSAVAESQRRTIRHERQRREELEKQLDKALKPPQIPAQDTEIKTSESAWALYQRAEQLAEENRSLRRQRDEVAHERERISNRILRLMSPGQYSQYAATAGYDPTSDSLILWKTDELRVLDQYSRWQKLYRTRVTARKMKEQRPLDEQAIEAALSDRWKLMTKPLKKLGKQPEWRIVGFLLDEESEQFLAKESRDRARRTVRTMQR